MVQLGSVVAQIGFEVYRAEVSLGKHRALMCRRASGRSAPGGSMRSWNENWTKTNGFVCRILCTIRGAIDSSM